MGSSECLGSKTGMIRLGGLVDELIFSLVSLLLVWEFGKVSESALVEVSFSETSDLEKQPVVKVPR